MAIEISENMAGGASYSIPAGANLKLLPDEILGLVGDFERSAFDQAEDMLRSAIDRCEHEGMRSWLASLAAGRFQHLSVHTALVGPGCSIKLSDVAFVYRVGGTFTDHSIQFRNGPTPEVISTDLRPIFDLVESINPVDPAEWNMAGGQLSYHEGPDGLFSSMGWNQPSDSINPNRVRSLFSSMGGDAIGCDEDGSAILCAHGEMSRIGTIADFVDHYFDLLRQGSHEVAYAQSIAASMKG